MIVFLNRGSYVRGKEAFRAKSSRTSQISKYKTGKMAELIGIAPRNLSNIETGRTFPSPENLEKIANVLKVKIKDLFDFEHQKDDIDLYSEIINRTKSVNRERLQDFYKIILSLTE